MQVAMTTKELRSSPRTFGSLWRRGGGNVLICEKHEIQNPKYKLFKNMAEKNKQS